MNEPKALVLDTHVWFWLMDSDGRLREDMRLLIEARLPTKAVSVSCMSVWELAMLDAKGRVRLSDGSAEWIRDALSAPGIALVPLHPEIAVDSTRLPGGFHGDPADRIIVATARHLSATLLTSDAAILRYAERGYLSAMRV